MIVGYYDNDKLIYSAKVRNGFVPRLRRDVWQKLKGLEIANCPFANLPEKKRTQFSLTREQMKDCVWIKPRLVAQVEFTEWTPDGHLRHSKLCGLREDKKAGGGWSRITVHVKGPLRIDAAIRCTRSRSWNLLQSLERVVKS